MPGTGHRNLHELAGSLIASEGSYNNVETDNIETGTLTVSGNATVNGVASAGSLSVSGSASTGPLAVTGNATCSANQTTSGVVYSNTLHGITAPTGIQFIDQSGDSGLTRITSPLVEIEGGGSTNSAVSLTGTLTSSGTVTAGSLSTGGNLAVGGQAQFITIQTTGVSTLQNNVNVTGTVTSSGTITANGGVDASTLTVASGTTAFGDSIDVSGNCTCVDVTASGGLTVTGTSTLNDNVTIAASKNLTVDEVDLRVTDLASVSTAGVQIPESGQFFIGRRTGSATYSDKYILPVPQRGKILYLTNLAEHSMGSYIVKAHATNTNYLINNQTDCEVALGSGNVATFICVSENTNASRTNWIAYGISAAGAYTTLA